MKRWEENVCKLFEKLFWSRDRSRVNEITKSSIIVNYINLNNKNCRIFTFCLSSENAVIFFQLLAETFSSGIHSFRLHVTETDLVPHRDAVISRVYTEKNPHLIKS